MIGPSELARLQRDPSAIAPYRWRIEYRGGGVLRQFDVDGLHYIREVDLTRVRRLVIEGHPAGDLVAELPAGVTPEAIVVRARNAVTPRGVTRTILYGFRIAGVDVVHVIAPDGRVAPYRGPTLLPMPPVAGGPR